MGRETYERLRNAGVGRLVKIADKWAVVVASSDCDGCYYQNQCSSNSCLTENRHDETSVKFLPVDTTGIEIREVENV